MSKVGRGSGRPRRARVPVDSPILDRKRKPATALVRLNLDDDGSHDAAIAGAAKQRIVDFLQSVEELEVLKLAARRGLRAVIEEDDDGEPVEVLEQLTWAEQLQAIEALKKHTFGLAVEFAGMKAAKGGSGGGRSATADQDDAALAALGARFD